MTTEGRATVIGPADGESVSIGGMGCRFMLGGETTGDRAALVEHPLAPRALAAPLHRHSREDEYSYVLEGRMGAQLGDEVLVAEAGDFVFKPRDQWHTFWNAGDEPARILELISPAGFERYFREVAELIGASGRDLDALGRLAASYGLELYPESIPGLVERHGLTFGP